MIGCSRHLYVYHSARVAPRMLQELYVIAVDGGLFYATSTEVYNFGFSLYDKTKKVSFVLAAFTEAEEKLGVLQIVVNNSGILQEFEWQQCFDVNLVCQLSLVVYCFYPRYTHMFMWVFYVLLIFYICLDLLFLLNFMCSLFLGRSDSHRKRSSQAIGQRPGWPGRGRGCYVVYRR